MSFVHYLDCKTLRMIGGIWHMSKEKNPLCSMEELQIKLKERMLPMAEYLEIDSFLLKNNIHQEPIQEFQEKFQLHPKSVFLNFVRQYDLNQWEFFNIWFGRENYLEELIEINTATGWDCWWGEGERPSEWLMIAQTDPYTFLLHRQTDKIYAITSDDKDTEWQAIAPNFEQWVRGIGTYYIEKRDIEEVICLVQAENKKYWRELNT